MHFRSVLWRGEKVAVSLEQAISLWAQMGEGGGEGEVYTCTNTRVYKIVANKSLVHSYEVGFAVSIGFPESLEGK